MRRSLLNILVDPISRLPLQIEEQKKGEGDIIIEGSLHSSEGKSYRITNGIPRFVYIEDPKQEQTQHSFGFKWQQRATYDSPQVYSINQQWLVERYGFVDVNQMQEFFTQRSRILDAGCGSGFSSSLWLTPAWLNAGQTEWFGVDISVAVDVAQERLGSLARTNFIQADILQLPFRGQSFDTIFPDGVLHHTPSTEAALKSLAACLEPEGQILFYVYCKKAPIREFTDDYIRDLISPLSPEEAWNALQPLTRLGQALAEVHAEIEVPEDIPYLGIKAGRHDVQRLIYWHFAKLFWNEAYNFEENNHINFDWYHPKYAHRHTEEEIRRWCEEANLKIIHFNVQESGYSVRANKD